MAAVEDRFYVFSEGQAGKVKRLRSNPAVRMAACDFKGRVLSDWCDGRARLVDAAGTLARANCALRKKYGWQMRVGDFFSRLTGRYARRAMLEIELGATVSR
ncbi:MAG: PPOX class F420-dependent oxidoreductase [Planctomycetota bacterium]|nr:PPOX class F420-dependent oxidoreductase [Planctomycetota bacterium]